MFRIAVTGGGHGGKSKFLAEFLESSSSEIKCVTIPELADTAFACGMDPKRKEFELFVYAIQRATEDAASAYSIDGITLCHRGTLDCLAFWIRKGWEEREFFAQLGTTWDEEYGRYAGIIHLETTASGAEDIYLNQKSSRQVEPINDARTLDDLCARVWRNHPRYTFVSNKHSGWPSKSSEALQAVGRLIALRQD